MRLLTFIFIISVALITGCSSSPKTFISEDFANNDLTSRQGVEKPEYNSDDIKIEFEKAANLPKPFRMGVFFKNGNSSYEKNWRWKSEDQSRILESIRKALPKDNVSHIFKIDDSLARTQDLEEIRLAAARYKADAVLVVEGLSHLQTELNRWSLSYALIVPTFFVQGNDLESIFSIKANLWDVRNERLYFTTSAEGEIKEKYSAALKKKDQIYVEKSKVMAIANFEQEVKKAFER